MVALLDAGANVDQPAADEDKSFPLMAGLHNSSCVSSLLACGASVAQVDAAAYSPLLAACEWGLAETVGALLAHGADTSFEGAEPGYTPLVAAAIGGRHTCVALLLEADVDPQSGLCIQKRAPGNVPKEGLDALGWARYRRDMGSAQEGCDFTEVVRLLSHFEELFADAIKVVLGTRLLHPLTSCTLSPPAPSHLLCLRRVLLVLTSPLPVASARLVYSRLPPLTARSAHRGGAPPNHRGARERTGGIALRHAEGHACTVRATSQRGAPRARSHRGAGHACTAPRL